MARGDRVTTQGEFRAAITRWSVAAAVPLLAIGAHGLAGGELPGTSGAILVAGIGVIASLVTRGSRVLGVFGILTAAQAASHLVLMGAHGEMWAFGDATSMLITHLLAVPASALAIAVVAQLISLISSVLRVVAGPVRVAASATVLRVWSQAVSVGVAAIERHAIRGPPLVVSAQ